MARSAILLDKNTHETTLIFIDADNAHEILPYLHRDKVDKEFKDIRVILKEGLRNKEKYCKADVSDKAKDVFEMRFTNNGRNDRIYCKEFHVSKRRFIVIVELYEGKKTQDISKKYKQRIENLGGYEYDFKF